MASLFLTGATGFIGRRLLERILDTGDRHGGVVCLVRSPDRIPGHLAGHPKIEWIEGELSDTESYLDPLSGCEVVVHLAARTGKARPEAFYQANAEGTRRLVEACGRAGVRRFLYMSTIAVRYARKGDYHYARSKRLGEEYVVGSSLAYTIVRPTVVIGAGSGVWMNLAKMARLPVPVVFGSGRVRLQPVAVGDLVEIVRDLIDQGRFDGECIEIGGPGVVTLDELLAEIRRAYGDRRRPVVHLPFGPLSWLARQVERFAYPVLPFNAGSLAFFDNDSTAQPHPYVQGRAGSMQSVSGMIARAVEEEKAACAEASTRKECRVFSRYLIGKDPTDYITEKYLEGLRVEAGRPCPADDPMDRALLAAARFHPFGTRLADAYAAFFRRKAAVRVRLNLLLAILECVPDGRPVMEPAGERSRWLVGLNLFGSGMAALAVLLLSILLFFPLRVAARAIGR